MYIDGGQYGEIWIKLVRTHKKRAVQGGIWVPTERLVTNRKAAGSIPAGVIGFFIDIKSFRSHYGPGVDSASNRNEYQKHILEVKAAGA